MVAGSAWRREAITAVQIASKHTSQLKREAARFPAWFHEEDGFPEEEDDEQLDIRRC